jgi:4-amino-4-deoxy-L-arabinose transferase-like glycosyltransferase
MSLAYRAYPVTTAYVETYPARWRRAFLGWLADAQAEAGWIIPCLLVGFVAVWLIYFSVAYVGGNLHPDVLETWTMGRSVDWGYSKHPPLMGWIARAWTSVFPLTDWSFHLLALTNSAAALWTVDLITRRFASSDKRLLVLLLLMLTPIYQFHAERFNANAVLLATWPLATYCFLRSFEQRDIGWAVAAGLAAALAMLGKYYSIFLIVSFALAAICHPQRRAYFGSAAPWLSAATGLIALAPHLYWLVTTGAQPFAYAIETHAGKPFGAALTQGVLFFLGVGMLLAAPAGAWVLLAGKRLKDFGQDFRAMNSGLLLLLFIGIGTLVFPPITALALSSDMMVIWSLQGLFLFVILIVCGARYQIERYRIAALAGVVVVAASLTALVAAPIHALYRNSHPLHEGRNFYRLAAEEVTQQWHALSAAPLETVGGDDDLAFAMAFYSPDHPAYDRRLVNPIAEELPRQVISEGGWVGFCFGGDENCEGGLQKFAALGGRVVKSELVFQSSLFGWAGATERFTAFMMLPASPQERIMAPREDAGLVEDSSADRRSGATWAESTSNPRR